MDKEQALRIVEAVIFASGEPIEARKIQEHLGSGIAVGELLEQLEEQYRDRGVRLEKHGHAYAFRTHPDVAPYLTREETRPRSLSRAALETLAIIAYRQPVTRAEIEEIRGVAVSSGTLDILLDAGFVKIGGRRDTPGRPVTWATTTGFLDHFDLRSLDDLPRLDELDGAGLLTRIDDQDVGTNNGDAPPSDGEEASDESDSAENTASR